MHQITSTVMATLTDRVTKRMADQGLGDYKELATALVQQLPTASSQEEGKITLAEAYAQLINVVQLSVANPTEAAKARALTVTRHYCYRHGSSTAIVHQWLESHGHTKRSCHRHLQTTI